MAQWTCYWFPGFRIKEKGWLFKVNMREFLDAGGIDLSSVCWWFHKSIHVVKFHKTMYLVTQSCSILCNPVNCSHQAPLYMGIFLAIITGVGFHALLQVIFPTQGSKPGLLHCRQILYGLSHQRSPYTHKCMQILVK